MLHLRKRDNWYQVEEGKNSLGIFIPRHSLKIRVLDKETRKAAEDKVLELEKATEWPWPPTPKDEPVEAAPLTLLDAYHDWLDRKPEGSSTRKAYTCVERILIEPLARQGVTLVQQVTTAHLDALQNSWQNEKKKKDARSLNTLQSWRKFTSCLFNYCVNIRKEIVSNPWKGVETIKEGKLSREDIMAGKRKDNGIATLPLDLKGKSNWLLIQANVPTFVKGDLPSQVQHRRNPLFQHAATFLTLLWLMYETGLRRSDALIFRPDWIVETRHGGSYTTPQVKTHDEVTVFLPQPLVDALRSLPLLKWRGAPSTPGAGLFPFYDGSGKDHEAYMKSHLNGPLAELGRLLGIQGSLRPHRFRDSFAVNMLSLGLSLEDLKVMLGHKLLATTEKYYAPYVLGMKEAVENRQAAARQVALFDEAQAVAPRYEVTVN